MKLMYFTSREIRHLILYTSILPAVLLISLLDETRVNGDLIIKPTDSEVVEGQNVRLRCSTSETMDVYWLHIPLGTSQSTPIYYDKEVVNGYNKRYRVEEDGEGKYDLILQNAQSADAGTYRCHDRVGSGEWSDAELIVLDSAPKCEAQDLTFCNVATRTFNISCSIIYAGRIRPSIGCSSPYTYNYSVITTEELGNRVAYSIHSNAHWSGMNHTSILCQTQLSNISSPIEVKTPYAFSSSSTVNVPSNELVECKANSSGPCTSYKWIEMKTGQISVQQTLKTNSSLGKHQCISECQLQSQSSVCRVTSLTIEVTPQGSEGDNSGIIIGIVVIVIFVVIAICATVGLVIFILKRRQKASNRKEEKGAKEEKEQLSINSSSNSSSNPV